MLIGTDEEVVNRLEEVAKLVEGTKLLDVLSVGDGDRVGDLEGTGGV